MKLTKHVGRIKNTGARIVIVFRQIPEEPNFSLVIETDRLTDMFHDNLIHIVNSNEAQDTVNLYEVLARKSFSNGENCLESVHTRGFLKKVPVSNVEMLPVANMPVPLEEINRQIDESNGIVSKPADIFEEVLQSDEPYVAPIDTVDLYSETERNTRAEQLLEQARKLESRAVQLREEAYLLMPEIRSVRGRPSIPEAEKKARLDDRNRRRRERYNASKSSDAV